MEKFKKKVTLRWSAMKKHEKFVVVASLLYLGIVGAFLMIHRSPYAPDQFFVLAFILVLLTGQAKSFLRDWMPPILFILAYEYLRSLIPVVNPHIHYELMINFDKSLFGGLPTVFLQNLLYSASHLHWYDYVSAFLYSSHFVIPLFVGFLFWMIDRKFFEKYIFGMVGLSYAGLATYLAFPAAPPWMASAKGLIPPISHATDAIFAHFFGSISLPTVYQLLGVNLTAAVPSLHAAYAIMVALFVSKKAPKLWPLMVIYASSVCFAVVYLGEHYFFDVVLGAIYALLVYLSVEHWEAIASKIKSLLLTPMKHGGSARQKSG